MMRGQYMVFVMSVRSLRALIALIKPIAAGSSHAE
jgi:hypothetical protein